MTAYSFQHMYARILWKCVNISNFVSLHVYAMACVYAYMRVRGSECTSCLRDVRV